MEDLAVRAVRGELGDLAHWLQAEARWGRAIGWDDLFSADSKEDLPGPHLCVQGFCFSGASFASISHQDDDSQKLLINALEQLQTPVLREFIADIIQYGVVARPEGGQRAKTVPELNLETLTRVVNVRGHQFILDRFFPVLETQLREPLLMSFLDLVGRNKTAWTGRNQMSPAMYEEICKAWIEHPNLEGLLPILSLWPKSAENCGFLGPVLASYRCSEPRFGAAAIILRVAQCKIEPDEYDAIASRFIEYCADERFDAIGAAAALGSMGRIRPDPVAAFLLALYRQLPLRDSHKRSAVMSGLDGLVRRRRSQLSHVDVQQALKVEFLSTKSRH